MRLIKFSSYFVAVMLMTLIFQFSCQHSDWDKYYSEHDAAVQMKLWDAVKAEPDFLHFVQLLEAYKLDTIFTKGLSYTLFIPDNDALAFVSPEDTAGLMISILKNHISETVFLLRNVEEIRALETLGGKFPLITQVDGGYLYDMSPIEYGSSLHRDGVYYKIKEVAMPRPNLYEFTERFSSVIKSYIDLSDSVYLDFNLSTPIGFDLEGNTIFDSVTNVVNRFERDFFPVSKEFRNKSATFILFTQDQYDSALDDMADMLGPSFTDNRDIPLIWQNKVFLPFVMKSSLFDNSLEFSQIKKVMVSVTGDTVYLDPANINPESRYQCSNGITYTVINFEVPKELYIGENRIEGERMIDSIGSNNYAWIEGVSTCGYIVAPNKQKVKEASEEALVSVNFPRNYTGEWCINFAFTNIFPMKYRLEWAASLRPSGLYSIYVNGEVMTRQDRFGTALTEFDTYDLRQSVLSVDGKTRFLPNGNINRVDFWVENITDFGDIEIRFEYKGPGIASENGFTIDYIALIPAQ